MAAPVFFHAGTAVSRLELSLSCEKCVRALGRALAVGGCCAPRGAALTRLRPRSTPEPTMLIGKTDPFIAVFTKNEPAEAWQLVGTTGTAAPRGNQQQPGATSASVPARAIRPRPRHPLAYAVGLRVQAQASAPRLLQSLTRRPTRRCRGQDVDAGVQEARAG
jgi:hypothetical protein